MLLVDRRLSQDSEAWRTLLFEQGIRGLHVFYELVLQTSEHPQFSIPVARRSPCSSRRQATATPKACYVCYKPTTTVLATAGTTDFLYTCDAHLADPGFASQLAEGADPGSTKRPGLNAEEIAKVKEEWEERQKHKQAREGKEKGKGEERGKGEEKDKGGEEKGEEAGKDSGRAEEGRAKAAKSPSLSTPGALSSTPSTGTSTPTHLRYALHRDIFSMRQAEHRKRRQTKQMQELAPKLPGAPRGPIPSS
jgi:AAA-ATPase Vps4-associated protein 1